MNPRKFKTRATPSNISHRFDKCESISISQLDIEGDWWYQDELEEPQDSTELIKEKCKSIISSNQSPDVPFNKSINPYRGCEHGCIYCYARPSHAYWDLSPGYDFESKIIYKVNAAELLEEKFNSRNYQCEPVCIGANTDGYQPVEKQLKITRQILELCLDYQHPVSIITKSQLINRDLDLLSALAEKNLTSVAISVTTLDNALKRRLEPRTSSPRARLMTIRNLSLASVPVTALVAPIIPGLNDDELEIILRRVSENGASTAAYIMLRLPFEVRTLFVEWLERNYPMRKQKVLNYLASLRNDKLNDPEFGSRMSGQGVFAELIRQRFELACKKYGLLKRTEVKLETQLFRPKRNVQKHKKLNEQQLTLF
ncbi:MAG: PA0069 family radical SAM protein [Kangiellaceae bacterium]|nr:PA0069 family radical SAM protein [Kangiellaceae bacterium]MCW8997780.1 PA0069 family radical SAM protein [Kangiellaceae bacterium]